jgi:HSP20 family protein
MNMNTVNRLYQVAGALEPTRARPFIPAVDLWEERDRLVVKADVPGFKRDELELSIDGDLLKLRGLRARELRDDDATLHLSARGHGAFEVACRLPYPVDGKGAHIAMENGELCITFVKSPERRRLP